MRRALPLLLVSLAAFGGCTRSEETKRDPLDLIPATDLDPADDVVEIDLVAEVASKEYLDGKEAVVWGYRDAGRGGAKVTVPGPLISGKVGDLLVVRVTNELPEPTTVHWHGLRLPASMDGTNMSQLPIPVGETFEYRFPLLDAGTFWYHPHVRADIQIENGLYAPLIVHPGLEPEVDVEADRTFVLDEVKLDADGTLTETMTTLDYMVGKQGNVRLVNGVNADRATLSVKDGARERWRFVNAANGRFFHLSLPGHSFLVIGWDGGLVETPYTSDTLLVSPGERYEVIVELDETADLSLQTLYYDRGHDLPDPGPLDLLQLRFDGKAGAFDPLPAAWGDVQPLPVDGSTLARSFVLSEVDDGGDGKPRFFINDEAWPFNNTIMGTLGELEIWEIVNTAEMDHPFHLHGVFFQVLDVDNVPETRLGWKDTVVVPQSSTLRFAVRYETPGMWMYHCHILEHAELGMMGQIMVMDTMGVAAAAPLSLESSSGGAICSPGEGLPCTVERS